MKHELHFVDLLTYHLEDCHKPRKTSDNLSELVSIARELRDCANKNAEQIRGYWAQIWIELEYGEDIMTF